MVRTDRRGVKYASDMCQLHMAIHPKIARFGGHTPGADAIWRTDAAEADASHSE
jgi:hypothetical protein